MSYNLQPLNNFKNGESNKIYLETDISIIKKHIDTLFGINCYLVPKILIKRNGNFDRWCINCYKIQETQKPLIIIFPEERTFIYDSINLHNTINLINTEINRNKEKYIHNNEIIELFEELILIFSFQQSFLLIQIQYFLYLMHLKKMKKK